MNSKLQNLINMRWYAFIGVGLLLMMAQLSHTFTVWIPSYYALAFFALSNLGFQFGGRKFSESVIDPVIFFTTVLDLFYLTLLLTYNGGPHNPFSILFIAICSVAAMSLPRNYLLGVIVVCLICLGLIYSMGQEHQHHQDSDYAFHLRGMWLANSVGVIVISFWIHHLRLQNDKIAEKHKVTQRILFQVERVESMGRILASTAHQMNTPLATMQLGISELKNKRQPLSESEKDIWLNDLQTAMDQISTLVQTIKTPDSLEDDVYKQSVDFISYLETLIARWSVARNLSVEFKSGVEELSISQKNLSEVTSVLESLLENAFDARRPEQKPTIVVCLDKDDSFFVMRVTDDGIGMDEQTLNRAMEPLYTTKKKGTGLGLYIAHQLAKKLGGSLEINSTLNQGTTVTFKFAKDALS